MVHKAHDARRNADFTADSFAIPRHVLFAASSPYAGSSGAAIAITYGPVPTGLMGGTPERHPAGLGSPCQDGFNGGEQCLGRKRLRYEVDVWFQNAVP